MLSLLLLRLLNAPVPSVNHGAVTEKYPPRKYCIYGACLLGHGQAGGAMLYEVDSCLCVAGRTGRQLERKDDVEAAAACDDHRAAAA